MPRPTIVPAADLDPLEDALTDLHFALGAVERHLPDGATPAEKIAHLALGLMRDAHGMLLAALDKT